MAARKKVQSVRSISPFQQSKLVGRQGVQGPKGDPGVPGSTGPQGPQGGRGESGPEGKRGANGVIGPSGSQGGDGRDGEQGLSGPAPDHKWKGNKLSFQRPDGTWGREVDLTGPQGSAGRGRGGGGGSTPDDIAAWLITNGYIEGMYAKNIDFEDSGNTIYKGEAVPGTAASAALWRISRSVLNAEGDTVVTWADGNANFDNVWDDHLTLSYS